WSGLGAGMDARVFAMTTHNGVLFAGGDFAHAGGLGSHYLARWSVPTADFNHDRTPATDQDIEDLFPFLAADCCRASDTADFNGDRDVPTVADIEAFFRVLAGGPC